MLWEITSVTVLNDKKSRFRLGTLAELLKRSERCSRQEASRCRTRDESEESIAQRQQSRQSKDPPWA